MNESTLSGHPAPPDLPPELLTEAAGFGQSSLPAAAAASAIPAPDMPHGLLAPTPQEAAPADEPLGPDLAEEWLRPVALHAPADAPAPYPTIEPTAFDAGIADPPAADIDDWAPSPSIPMTADVLPSSDEQTFEQKWDSLARRLQAESTVAESPAPPAPPDLPEEMLRPVGEVEVTGGEDHFEDD